MDDLNNMSKAALSAAMRGGTAGWGEVGSAYRHIRYMELRPNRPGRKPKCCCGCNGVKTHIGMANGVCLISGCEWRVRKWVKEGKAHG